MNEFLICEGCGHAWVTHSWTKDDACLECGRKLTDAILVQRVEVVERWEPIQPIRGGPV